MPRSRKVAPTVSSTEKDLVFSGSFCFLVHEDLIDVFETRCYVKSVISKTISGVIVASLAVIALTGCAGSGQPTPNPTQTALASPLTAEEAWDSFAKVAYNSCQTSYDGLVEEDIEGPNTGKLKIRLTFEQAGENSFAYKLPNGDVGMLNADQYYACEARYLLSSFELADGTTYSYSPPPYSADWPITVSFDHVTATYLTTQIVEGNQRNLAYTVEDGVFSLVENAVEGSKTTLTFGLPDAEMTAIVNDFYKEMYGN